MSGSSSGGAPATDASGGSGGANGDPDGADGAGGVAPDAYAIGDARTADAGIDDGRADAGPVVVGLPFVVDAYFVPTGYMGDGLRPGAILIETSGCKLPRPAGARGSCYRITYRPQPPATMGGPAWAGVYWLAPQDN